MAQNDWMFATQRELPQSDIDLLKHIMACAEEVVGKLQEADQDLSLEEIEAQILSSYAKDPLGEEVAKALLPTWEFPGIPDFAVWESGKEGFCIAHFSGDSSDAFDRLLRIFLPRSVSLKGWGYEWSSWCNKPRADNFYGGAVYVAAEGQIEYCSPSTWLQEREKRSSREQKDRQDGK